MRLTGCGKLWQLLQRVRDIGRLQIRVTVQGEANATMPGKLLCHLRMYACRGEITAKLMAQGVKIKASTSSILI